jgi:hypothetical protein
VPVRSLYHLKKATAFQLPRLTVAARSLRDSFFPTQTISQIIDLIDSGAFFPSGTLPRQKIQLIATTLELVAYEYPAAEKREFSILFATRFGSGMKGELASTRLLSRRGNLVALLN